MNRWIPRMFLSGYSLLFACSEPAKDASGGKTDSGQNTTTEDTSDTHPSQDLFDDAALLRRMSFDFRGIPPEREDLEAVLSDSDALDALREDYLHDDRFGERMVHLYGETWHTRVDVFDIVVFDYGLTKETEYSFERAIGEEPLRILSRVITEDLPWTEVVLGDWTMATDLMASIWPLSYPEGQTGWQVATYTDGRPAAGVMSTNGLWWRYTTTDSNMNRGRAAAISRLLLCEDYLTRPVSFADADTIGASTANTANQDPYCLACHAALDPVAASLFGFWWVAMYSEIEETTYHPEREALWETLLGVAPGWYGTPISGLSDLGVSVARDSRFYTCAVETLAQTLWRRPITLEDATILEALRQGFIEEGVTIRPLLTAISRTDAYQSTQMRMLTHDQFRSSLEALTGFTWTREGFDEIDSDETGFRLLLGGVDGFAIRSPLQQPGLTWALVVKRATEGAAAHAVENELNAGGPRTFFENIELTDRPGDAVFSAELESLHWRLFSREADSGWLTEITALWSAIEEDHGPAIAWQSVASAMLRDPAFVTY
jgi:hypothetical protein